MEDAPPQESIRQFFFGIAGDNGNRTVNRSDGFIGFRDIENSSLQFRSAGHWGTRYRPYQFHR